MIGAICLGLAAAAAVWAADPFVPADFKVPAGFQTKSYKLVPLGPDLVKVDFDAYMSSIEHLQKTFSNGTWPHAGITLADAMKDMDEEKDRFDTRKSFAYGVLTKDGKQELGSFYLRPSSKRGFDAEASLWVTKAQFDKGFEAVLVPDMKSWIAKRWPFQKVAWPRRDISAQAWAALPDEARRRPIKALLGSDRFFVSARSRNSLAGGGRLQ